MHCSLYQVFGVRHSYTMYTLPIEPDAQCLVKGTRQLLCTCDIITFLPLVQLSPLLQKQCAADKTQTCAVDGD